MEHADTSSFPIFTDGDVTLVVSSEHIYRLHASVLRRCSGFFASVLTENHAAKLSTQAKRAGNTLRFHLQLTYSPAKPNGVFQMKVRHSPGRRYDTESQNKHPPPVSSTDRDHTGT